MSPIRAVCLRGSCSTDDHTCNWIPNIREDQSIQNSIFADSIDCWMSWINECEISSLANGDLTSVDSQSLGTAFGCSAIQIPAD